MARPQRTESSRDRILKSALEEYSGYGFAGARIDRIARRVKLNVRMIYYHFGSKEGLYRAVLKEIYEQCAKMLSRVVATVEDPEKRSIEALDGYIQFLQENPAFAGILVRELLDGAPRLRALFKDEPHLYEVVHGPATAMVEGAVKAGEFRPVPAGETVLVVIASALFTMATRRVHDIFLMGRESDLEALREHIKDVMLNGLRAR